MNSLIGQAIARHKMIEKGDRVIAALSGGADSVTLLHFLCKNAESLGITVGAAHVNHLLRGEESDRDEQFCRELCRELNVPLTVRRVDIATISKQQRLSTEECARNVRYSFFEELADGQSGCKIATAHTLSDCSETLILNITRGSSMAGLRSIPPVRGRIIRPLIDITRQQVERYIADNRLRYVTDSSNLTDDYTRNIIRHRIIPVLKQINPTCEQSFGRTIACMRRDEDYLTEQTERALVECSHEGRIFADRVKALHPSIRTRLIKRLIESCGDISFELIDAADRAVMTNEGINLPGDRRLSIQKGALVILPQRQAKAQTITDEPAISPETPAKFGGLTVSLQIINREEYNAKQNINKNFVNACLDYDMILGNTYIRSRRPSDRFSPKNRGVTKSLKKLFNELKTEPSQRDRLFMLCDDGGIIFIQTVGCCDRVKVTDKTERICLISSRTD